MADSRFNLVHAADLHLDSPLCGLLRYPGAPVEEFRAATRRALRNLVELCEVEEVRLLLLAGDLFDGEWRDYSTGLFFADRLAALGRAGTQVVLVRGNHDAASQVAKHLRLPKNVKELSHDAPETQLYPELGIAVHGQSYARREETVDLSRAYPDPVPGLLNIGLLHTALSGRAGHEPYAPCKLEALLAKGYDYWALGHVHQREVLHQDPWVVFSGNLQGRHVKETGPKGATLIRVEDGRVHSVEHRALDVVRWANIEVELGLDQDADAAVDAAADAIEAEQQAAGERVLALRLTLTGRTRAHGALERERERWAAQIRARASELGKVWLEAVRFQTQPSVSFEELALRGDALGQVARTIAELEREPSTLGPWLSEFEELASKLPVETLTGPAALRLTDPASMGALLPDVAQLLLSRLLELGEPES